MRKLLKYSLLGFCAVGFVFTAYPFVASMNPSHEARGDIPSFKTSWIEVGETKKTPDVAFPADVFITRLSEDDFLIFAVAYDKRRNIYWVGPPYDECNEIKVDLETNKILCMSGEQVYISWAFDGKPEREPYAELYVLPYSKNGKYIRYGRGA
ncbi:hypothetical protein [Neptuniibacter sp.]|uniref:hypothetical protein n=1 Tax=Neptuniibacter sp. TaxID=1962643 RepID=UPI003B5C4FDF